jgi:hypothetical protein
MTNTALHELVHQLLLKGQLPTDPPRGVYAGYGHGENCDACSTSMPAPAVVYEIDVGTGAAAKVFTLHLDCYEAWRAELKRVRSERK